MTTTRRRARGRNDLGQFGLAAGHGVLGAREREAAARPAEAALLHADAHPDVVEPPLGGLPRHPRVGHEGARHRDQVAGALGEQALGVARIGDPSRIDHGRPHLLLDAGRERGVRAGRRVGERHELLVVARRLARRARDREVVELAEGVERPDDLHHVLQVEAVRDELVAADAQPEDEVAADRGPDRPDHLDREAEPVLEASPVLVGPPVHRRHPELVHEVAREGAEIGAVESRALEAARRGGVRLNDLGDLPAVERVGDLPVLRLGDVGGRDERPLARTGEPAAPAVRDLRHHVGAFAVDRARERLEHREGRVIPVLDAVPVEDGARWMHARAPEALDQPRAAPGLLLVVPDVAFGDVAVLPEPRRVRGADDPVPERDVAQPEGREQMPEGGHAVPPCFVRYNPNDSATSRPSSRRISCRNPALPGSRARLATS